MRKLVMIGLLLFGAIAHANDYREAAWGTLSQVAAGALPTDFIGLSQEGGAALKAFAEKIVAEVEADAVKSAAAQCDDRASLKANNARHADTLEAIRSAERAKRGKAVADVQKVLNAADFALFQDFVYQEAVSYVPTPDVVAAIRSGNYDREKMFEKICKKGEK